MNLEVATATEKAAREVNQDRIFSRTARFTKDGKSVPVGLFCVADGVGGLMEGEFAAQATVLALEEWWGGELRESISEITRPQIFEKFFRIFQSVNAAILERSRAENIQLGTTCTVLLIVGEKYYIAHTGDSRIYWAKRGIFAILAKFKQLTIDHTKIRPEQPTKTKLTSCLGIFSNPKIFTSDGIIKKPCAFLVCSDGLYKAVSAKALRATLVEKGNAEKAIAKLMQQATKASDNVSVVVAKIV